MRLFLIALLLYVVPVWAQWGGDSRFYRTAPIPREGLVVDLDFSQFSHSGGVYTIRNMANAAAPAYMYGGLDFNSIGSDSSGLSRDPHTGRAVMAMDGSAGDSVVTVPDIVTIDSTGKSYLFFDYKIKATGTQYIAVMRLDTSGTGLTGNYSTAIQVTNGDSIRMVLTYTDGTQTVGTYKHHSGIVLNEWFWVGVSKLASSVVLYINNDSTYGITTTKNLLRSNRLRFSGRRAAEATSKACGSYGRILLYSRALTSAERTALYENATRGIHSKKKFSRW